MKMMKIRMARTLATMALILVLSSVAWAQTYPLKNAPTLTFWELANGNWANRFQTYADTPLGKELVKRTGVNVVYTNPSATQAQQAFNLMLASGELTDIIAADFIGQPGGPNKAIKDGAILRLNEAIAKWAPNLTAYLKAHPDIDKMIKTDDGDYYGFPFLRGDDYLMVYQGPIVRKDWLDDLGLKIPETIDDWTVMLRAFKAKKGATAPYVHFSGSYGDWNYAAIVGAYNTQRTWYVDNGKVKYGPAEPQFKDFVTRMAGWYKEGLLDPNIFLTDPKTRDSLFTTGKAGATIANTGGGIGYLTRLMAEKDPKAIFVAAPYPVLKRGDKPQFGQRDLPFNKMVFAISARSKNVETAVRYLDYGYSAEGALLYNFGIPGVSYNMVNGYPTYSELVMKNPKLSMAEAMSEYIRGNTTGPFIQDRRYMEQYAALPAQKDSINLWKSTDMAKHLMPPIAASDAEAPELARIMAEVETYVSESLTKFTLGVDPITNYDRFAATLKKLNIDRAVAIYQKAYDLYAKR